MLKVIELHSYYNDPELILATVQKDAVKAVALLTELLVKEAVQRSVSMAETQGSCELDVDHLAAILPQLLLDFS